jgi:UDP-N-acetylmuramoyl-tripeptide--D-alanyl-D-alanine ligase
VSFPLDETALDSVEASLRAGTPLAEAVAPYLRAYRTGSGGTVVDDADGAARDDVAAALRFLAQFTPGVGRSIAILGEFDAEPADALEEHDYIGRLIVRLNIDLLVAVGREARHIQSAAGLEGSWDGESVIVDSAGEAYDLLRGNIRENDVVLVKASPRAGLETLAYDLAAVTA